MTDPKGQPPPAVDGNGRVAKMVRWLIYNQERIGRPEKVQVTFACAGQSVIAELMEREQIETR